MSIGTVRAHFAALGMEERILEFPVSSATVELAAEALNTEGRRIAKTLSFADNGGCMLILFAGDARVDNRKFRERFGIKARMLPSGEVERLTGHAVGGVCPFGIDGSVPVYLDISLQRFYTVFPAAGSANSAIEFTPDELYRYSGARGWVDVAKDWEKRYDQPIVTEFLPADGLCSDEIELVPTARVDADGRTGFVPAYRFGIRRRSDGADAGCCDLRLGYRLGTYYGGNIGYEVYEGYRGNHYAEKACRLLFLQAARHNMPHVYICCHEDNIPSRRTLERLGGAFLGVVTVPPYTRSYRDGLRRECIFRYDLPPQKV